MTYWERLKFNVACFGMWILFVFNLRIFYILRKERTHSIDEMNHDLKMVLIRLGIAGTIFTTSISFAKWKFLYRPGRFEFNNIGLLALFLVIVSYELFFNS